MMMKEGISRDPLGIANPALKKIRQIQYDENFDLYDGHIVSKDGRYMLVFINPSVPGRQYRKEQPAVKGYRSVDRGSAIEWLQRS